MVNIYTPNYQKEEENICDLAVAATIDQKILQLNPLHHGKEVITIWFKQSNNPCLLLKIFVNHHALAINAEVVIRSGDGRDDLHPLTAPNPQHIDRLSTKAPAVASSYNPALACLRKRKGLNSHVYVGGQPYTTIPVRLDTVYDAVGYLLGW